MKIEKRSRENEEEMGILFELIDDIIVKHRRPVVEHTSVIYKFVGDVYSRSAM